jgi:hypothetical protein
MRTEVQDSPTIRFASLHRKGEEHAVKVAIIYYSMYGHVYQLARAVEEGAKSVAGTECIFRPGARVPEVEQQSSAATRRRCASSRRTCRSRRSTTWRAPTR